jgi:hypothetical protein
LLANLLIIQSNKARPMPAVALSQLPTTPLPQNRPNPANFTLRFDQSKIRVISARDMHRKERGHYEQEAE